MDVKSMTRVAHIAKYLLLWMFRRPNSCFRDEVRKGGGRRGEVLARGGDI